MASQHPSQSTLFRLISRGLIVAFVFALLPPVPAHVPVRWDLREALFGELRRLTEVERRQVLERE